MTWNHWVTGKSVTGVSYVFVAHLFDLHSLDCEADAVLVSIDDWADAGSKELYIYGRVHTHTHGPLDMDRRFRGHLPLAWMHQSMIGVTQYLVFFQ